MLSATPPDARTWRGADLAIAFGAAVALGLIGVLALQGPGLVALLPAAVLGFAAVLVLIRLPDLHRLAVVLALGTLTFNYEEGVQITEVLYGLLVYGYLAHWYLTYLLGQRRLLRSSSDTVAALFIVGAIFGGTALGFLFGANLTDLRGEILGISAFLFYFPVKEAIVREEKGATVVAFVLVWFGVFAAIRLGLLFHSVLTGATEWWQILDARVSAGEVHFMAGFLCIAAMVTTARGRKLLLAIAITALIVVGLILAKSRGPWLATALGTVVMLALLPWAPRRRFVFAMAAVVAVGGIAAFVFLGDSVNLILLGLTKRLGSIGGAATQDPSLLNRWAESGGALARIRTNPVLGYGWGISIPYHSLLQMGRVTGSFLHNGYIALWVKVGIWGLGLFIWLLLGAFLGGARAARARVLTPTQRALGASAAGGAIAFAFLTFLSNPLLLQDQMTTFTVLLALAHGLAQRADRLSTSALSPLPYSS